MDINGNLDLTCKDTSLLEVLPIGVLILNSDLRVSYANSQFLNLIGYSLGEIMDKTDLDLTASKYITLEKEFYNDPNQDLNTGLFKKEYIHKSGHSVSVLARRFVTVIDGERCFYLMVEERFRETVLSRSSQVARKTNPHSIVGEETLQEMVEHFPIMIDSFDQDGKCILWNRQCEDIMGYSQAELNKYDDILSLFYPDEKERERVLDTIISPDGVFREFNVQIKGGEMRQQRWANFQLSNGVIISCGQDITEQKHLEKSLVEAKEVAEQAAKLKTNFLSSMSHEIRTPMNGLLGMVSLISHTELNGVQAEYIETIRSCGESLLKILNDILDFNKLEAGKVQLEYVPFDIRKSIVDAQNLFYPIADAKQLELDICIDDNVPSVFVGDVIRIRQVVDNLISNAIKFTESGAVTVIVSANATSDVEYNLQIKVQDTGIGISKENQKFLFDEFTQADSSIARRFGGTGLGLAISSKLVNAMGGSVEVRSELGTGTEVLLQIPLKRMGSGVLSKPKVHQHISEVTPIFDTSRIRILVAEDNFVNQKLMRLMLSKAGHEVDLAENGLEALEALKNKEYDLILMDMQMPMMDGITATKEIKKEFGSDHPPIVALTANVFPEDRQSCFDAGMVDFAIKPIKVQTLEELIEKYVSGDKAHKKSS